MVGVVVVFVVVVVMVVACVVVACSSDCGGIGIGGSESTCIACVAVVV